MNTEIIRFGEEEAARAEERFREVILQGGLAAFPTETVYGLGGNGLDPLAAKKIYTAKGRPSDNPLILHIGDREALAPLVKRIPDTAEKLMDAFWPGPLTLIFEKSDLVPFETTGGLTTVAVRMPSHPAANRLLLAAGIPVAAPSANLSGRPSPTTADHVIHDLNGRIDLIIDGGPSEIGLESTILDLSEEKPVLLRPGYVTLGELEAVIGEIGTDPAIRRENIISGKNEVLRPKAPGMKYRHYAPKAPLFIVYGDPREVAEAVNRAADGETGVIVSEEHRTLYQKGRIRCIGTLSEPESIAHSLYDVLRGFDGEQVSVIYSEDFSDADISTAIMNRLLKAAGGNYIDSSKVQRRQQNDCNRL